MEESSAKKILIVEDDESLAAALTTLLKAQGYSVKAAYDAKAGTGLAVSDSPNLIVLDLGLPAGGGFSVLQNLRASQDTKGIPVVVLTALTDRDMEPKACQLGASVFIRKPYEPEILLEKIKGIIG